uniref:Short-chain dehydrogenase/reductase family protein n=1 Tax=Mycena chlorophos TaxID=658473 RepID=A0ABQ0LK61_MYCCL|nr:short-chain dehydrogenase/reductase family protein [Mycena chlorophos]
MASLPTFSFHTTAEQVADSCADIIRGKNVLVTGTSLNGIGYETARVVAKYANLVIITGYNEERLKLTEAEIKKSVPSAKVRRLALNLLSQAAVREAAAEVNAYSEPIHVLINNAAASAAINDGAKSQRTPDLDVDVQWATNHFGPFLFTKLLLPKLYAAARASPGFTPRVVWVSAKGHQFGGGVDLDNLGRPDPEAEGYSLMNVYFATKSANIMIASEMARRAAGKVNAYSLHPGVIFTNVFMRMKETNSFPAEMSTIGIVNEQGDPVSDKFPWKSIEEGAASTVAAAFDPRLDATPGAYIDDCNVAMEEIAPHTADPSKAARLWSLTEEMIGEKFEF